MYTHPEPGILESEAKWARGNITTNRGSAGDGIPAELFQILKDDAVKVLHYTQANLENSAVATGPEKVSFHPNPEEGQDKESSNYHTIVLISLKLGFSSTWTKKFQIYKLDLEKTEEPEIKLPTSIGS